MSIPVGNHGLTCLDGNDPAAVALSLKANATAISSSLSSIDTKLDSYLGRFWWSATNTNTITVDDASGTVLPLGAVGANLKNDGTLAVQANGFPASQFIGSTFVWPEGIYLAGATVKYTVATPNNNTGRTLWLVGVDRIDGVIALTTTFDEIYRTAEYEQSAAGNDGSLEVIGFIKAESTPPLKSIESCFSHSNTSSDIVIPPGAWRLWFMHMGSGLVI